MDLRVHCKGEAKVRSCSCTSQKPLPVGTGLNILDSLCCEHVARGTHRPSWVAAVVPAKRSPFAAAGPQVCSQGPGATTARFSYKKTLSRQDMQGVTLLSGNSRETLCPKVFGNCCGPVLVMRERAHRRLMLGRRNKLVNSQK